MDLTMKMLSSALLAMASASVPVGAAVAAPAYLNCEFEGQAKPIKVTVDEAAGTAAVFIPASSNSFNMAATFTVDKILFHYDALYYELDRIALGLVRTERRLGFVDKGKCAVEKPTQRAV